MALNRRIKAMCLRHEKEITVDVFEVKNVVQSPVNKKYYRVTWMNTIEREDDPYARGTPRHYTYTIVKKIHEKAGYVEVAWDDSDEPPINLIGSEELLEHNCKKFKGKTEMEIDEMLIKEQEALDGRKLTAEELEDAETAQTKLKNIKQYKEDE